MLIINFVNLKTSKEGELLRRVLSSIGKKLKLHKLNFGTQQEDPFDLINEHIKLQKKGNPLYPYMDSDLRFRLANLEKNIT